MESIKIGGGDGGGLQMGTNMFLNEKKNVIGNRCVSVADKDQKNSITKNIRVLFISTKTLQADWKYKLN